MNAKIENHQQQQQQQQQQKQLNGNEMKQEEKISVNT